MKNKKKFLILSVSFLVLSILFTILVKFVDVQAIGPNNSKIGFATINQFIFKTIGVN